MSTIRTLQQGINAVQAKNYKEGVRLLRAALREPDITSPSRALAHIWLAETTDNRQEKLQHYTEALKADPDNEYAQRRFAQYAAPDPSSTPPPPAHLPEAPVSAPPPAPVYRPEGVTIVNAAPPPPITSPAPAYRAPSMSTSQLIPINPAVNTQQPQTDLGSSYHIVGIVGGPNGSGSGFFVARHGIIATTRYVVGGQENVTVELETGRQLPGRVIYSLPALDLAFIYVEQQVTDLLPVTVFPHINDNTQLTVISHNRKMMNGKKRETARMLEAHWFPTDIVSLPDAGGGPVFDERHYLVGMITRNISSSSAYVYGLHINTIREHLEKFFHQMRTGPNRVYCHTCGYVSQAAAAGGYYCEACGSTMPFAQQINRLRTPQIAVLYEENNAATCTKCGAHTGFYHGVCLRCGSAQAMTQ